MRLDQDGRPAWTRLSAEQVRATLGPGAFVNGVGPAPRMPSDDDGQWYLEAQGGALDGQRVCLNDQDSED